MDTTAPQGPTESYVRMLTCDPAPRFATRRFCRAVLLLIVIAEAVILLLRAAAKPLWYDEVLTYYVSGLGSFSTILQALRECADGMPPLYYQLLHWARALPVDSDTAIRIPSVGGYLLTLIGVYLFIEKRLSSAVALCAMALVPLLPFRQYAVEARPYALLVGLLAAAAVLWQRADERRYYTPLCGLCLAGATSFHYLGIFGVAAFIIAEAVFAKIHRRIRYSVWCALTVATIPFLVCLPLLLTFNRTVSRNFWGPPAWSNGYRSYNFYLGMEVYGYAGVAFVVFATILLCSAVYFQRWKRDGAPEKEYTIPELVLAAALFYDPLLLLMLAKLTHGGYTPRYGWPATIAIAMLTAWCISRFRMPAGGLALAFAAGIGFQQLHEFATLGDERTSKVDAPLRQMMKAARDYADLPLVIGSPTRFMTAVHYAPKDYRDRFYRITDEPNAIRFVDFDTLDVHDRRLSQFAPYHREDLRSFESRYSHFLFCSGGYGDWMTRYLINNNSTMRLVDETGKYSIFEVTARSPGADGSDKANAIRPH